VQSTARFQKPQTSRQHQWPAPPTEIRSSLGPYADNLWELSSTHPSHNF
jgi:hypothetical protein